MQVRLGASKLTSLFTESKDPKHVDESFDSAKWLRSMIQQWIQTALILEVVVDWDVLFKTQITEVARGTRDLQNSLYGENRDYNSRQLKCA